MHTNQSTISLKYDTKCSDVNESEMKYNTRRSNICERKKFDANYDSAS